ncbi:hypothetical protein AB9K41_21790, partial [Cribrihabitans sp. XS_ASV171]
NTCRMARRREIAPEKFARSIGIETWETMGFDAAAFGTAAAEGRTIREQSPRGRLQASLRRLASDLTGRSQTSGRFRKLLGLG